MSGCDFVGRQIEQAVVLEEIAARRLRYRPEAVRMLRERAGEFVRGGFGEFRRLCLYDHEQRRAALRERLVDRLAARGPRRLGFDQLADVGADPEVMDDVNRAQHGEEQRYDDDPRRPANGNRDEAGEVGRQHEDGYRWCYFLSAGCAGQNLRVSKSALAHSREPRKYTGRGTKRSGELSARGRVDILACSRGAFRLATRRAALKTQAHAFNFPI
jgi:hypothetical protein